MKPQIYLLMTLIANVLFLYLDSVQTHKVRYVLPKTIQFSWYFNKQHDSHVDLKKIPMLLNERKEIETPTKVERKIKIPKRPRNGPNRTFV